MANITHGDTHVTDRSTEPHRSPTLVHMSSIPTPRSARSADVVNEQIRDLWARTGGQLTAQDRAEYEALVTEWASVAGEGLVQRA